MIQRLYRPDTNVVVAIVRSKVLGSHIEATFGLNVIEQVRIPARRNRSS